MKQVIRLRENELRTIIYKTTKKILNEMSNRYDVVMGAFDSFSDLLSMDYYDNLSDEQKIQINNAIDQKCNNIMDGDIELGLKLVNGRMMATISVVDGYDDEVMNPFSIYLD